jgi:hypothetical protein
MKTTVRLRIRATISELQIWPVNDWPLFFAGRIHTGTKGLFLSSTSGGMIRRKSVTNMVSEQPHWTGALHSAILAETGVPRIPGRRLLGSAAGRQSGRRGRGVL